MPADPLGVVLGLHRVTGSSCCWIHEAGGRLHAASRSEATWCNLVPSAALLQASGAASPAEAQRLRQARSNTTQRAQHSGVTRLYGYGGVEGGPEVDAKDPDFDRSRYSGAPLARASPDPNFERWEGSSGLLPVPGARQQHPSSPVGRARRAGHGLLSSADGLLWEEPGSPVAQLQTAAPFRSGSAGVAPLPGGFRVLQRGQAQPAAAPAADDSPSAPPGLGPKGLLQAWQLGVGRPGDGSNGVNRESGAVAMGSKDAGAEAPRGEPAALSVLSPPTRVGRAA